MNNDKGQKIDINGSVSDSINGLTGTAIIWVVVLLLFALLFAPAFASCFEAGLERKNANSNGHVNYQAVREKMAFIRIMLCFVSLIAWAFVIYNYMYN